MDGLIIPKITKAKKAIKLKVVTQSLSFTLTHSLSLSLMLTSSAICSINLTHSFTFCFNNLLSLLNLIV